MNDFIKADVFFLVTTIAVVVVSVLLVIALVYAIKILRDMKFLYTKVKDEGERIIDDVRTIREETLGNSARLLGSALSFFGIKSKSKTNKKKDN